MSDDAFVLIDSGLGTSATADRLAEVFGTSAQPIPDTTIINLGDVAADFIRGDLEPGFRAWASAPHPTDRYPLKLRLTDVADEGRARRHLDEAAGRIYERIAASTGWHIGLALLDPTGDYEVVHERKSLTATA